MFCRRITTEEWVHFQGYAARVHELQVQSGKFFVAPLVWSVLSRQCAEGALVPRCQRLLEFRIADPSSGFTELMLLQSPNLRHLELDLTTYMDAADETIHMLALELLPIVNRVEILTLRFEWRMNDEPERAIPFWKYSNLQTLKVQPDVRINRSTLQSLMHFPHLHALEIELGGVDVGDEPLDPGFAQLQELSLVGSTDRVHSLMQAASPPHLTTIAMRLTDVHQQNALHLLQLVDQIYATLSPCLREFSLAFEAAYTSVPYVLLSTGRQLLLPLLNMNLVKITLHCHNHFVHVSEHDLQHLVDAWPELTVFEFTQNRDILSHLASDEGSLAGIPAPTISTVAAFAAAHLHLKHLALPCLDVRAVPEPDDLPRSALGHPLEKLAIAHHETEGVPLCGAALALDSLFPNLDIPDSEELTERYSKLQSLLLGMQTMRRRVARELRPE